MEKTNDANIYKKMQAIRPKIYSLIWDHTAFVLFFP